MNEQAMNEQMTTDEFNARLELIKRRAWNDLYYFSKHVCGKDLMRTQPHKELCDFIIHGVAGSE